jgi:hypothetical protein
VVFESVDQRLTGGRAARTAAVVKGRAPWLLAGGCSIVSEGPQPAVDGRRRDTQQGMVNQVQRERGRAPVCHHPLMAALSRSAAGTLEWTVLDARMLKCTPISCVQPVLLPLEGQLTPYQGPHKVFGYFKCPGCDHRGDKPQLVGQLRPGERPGRRGGLILAFAGQQGDTPLLPT